jgi:hypothetical protein
MPSRRTFLGSAAVSPLGFATTLRPVSAAETRIDPALVRIDSGIEPVVRLLEETPRDRVLEELGRKIKTGLTYPELLTALFLAGVRNVPPRPTVGFKFHCVLMIHSAHQSSLAAPDGDRWLPLLWAADRFKASQADARKEGDWRMKPADEAKLPPARKAREAFIDAMDRWNEPAADAATAVLARTAGANELFDLYAKYGCRDFRDIGHKAIYVANAFRTLQVIGWQHAEPILRSLTYALLQHEGDNPFKRDADADRPGRQNLDRLGKDGNPWRGDVSKQGLTADLIAQLRTANAEAMSETAFKLCATGTSPRPVWDALFLGGAELLMRQPGIVALHSLTSLNALHYHFTAASDETTRKLCLLQAAAFVPLFRDAMKARGKVEETKIDELKPAEKPATTEAIYDTLTKDKPAAAAMALAALKADPAAAKSLSDAGRQLIFRKGTDSHDYKFSAAVLEDASAISPEWRDRFRAASLFWMKGKDSPDSLLAKRISNTI